MYLSKAKAPIIIVLAVSVETYSFYAKPDSAMQQPKLLSTPDLFNDFFSSTLKSTSAIISVAAARGPNNDTNNDNNSYFYQ